MRLSKWYNAVSAVSVDSASCVRDAGSAGRVEGAVALVEYTVRLLVTTDRAQNVLVRPVSSEVNM